MRSPGPTPLGRLVALVLACGVGVGAGAAGAAATRPRAEAYRCVVIRPHDTLWVVAERVSRGDPRPVVDRIMARNGLRTAAVSPGTAVWVPVDGPSDRVTSSSECGTVP